jgi:hypothetical protein
LKKNLYCLLLFLANKKAFPQIFHLFLPCAGNKRDKKSVLSFSLHFGHILTGSVS